MSQTLAPGCVSLAPGFVFGSHRIDILTRGRDVSERDYI